MSERVATELTYEKGRRMLVVAFDDGQRFELPASYLRTHSPSAEVRGHGLSEPKLLPGKDEVAIVGIEPIGSYAVVLKFDDGHDSGIYGWNFLYGLGRDMDRNLARYAERMREAGLDVPAGPA
ncbi:DUF971 domain-containing protein [Wenzhouxiangella sp. XN79A]|uniref:gamma-butyrobetaine hydroxylase-like domain-containing protein n=1 Tax=Wenzhouxiangella sp. XN79A TaxID=2724193 RepID=UPI00144A52E0|nr:DUF971 domain-containing protein [Wenzhouxiangella sp. XN79A]